ncbi:F420-dependent glucose-6-phosphate dehydrogenase [Baekduia alba]|uniref:LLM class flavin-dependent oxidoreductase n=1 Tax=Baekduia alba TaxID=2997333 RepID=UPI0023415A69|nr:LLM class flavin-dependent oxidoreductase [Baekduia alba]WCB91808.1 F420-dependent glucose-6-phosphate dehydrogenase [Baekduia alba]
MLPVQDFGDGFAPSLAMARESERLGFDSVWIGDHLVFRQPIVEAIVMASTVAAITDSITIGFGVLQLALRDPVWLAKQLGTLAHLSGDRIEVGVGLGGENPAEWLAARVPPSERVGRTAELMKLMPALLSGQPVTHSGRYYSLDVPALRPAPERTPTLWMGGRSEGALRRAARLADGWLGLWVDEARLARSVADMAALAAEADRPAPATALVVPVIVQPDPAVAEQELTRFVAMQYGGDYQRFARWCVSGSVDAVAERLSRLAAAGATGFVLMPAARDPLADLEPLAAVRAAIRG